MHSPVKAAGCLASALVLMASIATAQTLNGPNFQVQTYNTGPQGASDVAIDSGGHFVVVWAGQAAHDDDYNGIVARRFLSSGQALGAEFAVNTFTTLDQNLPAVAVDGRGRFVVVWQSRERDGDMYGVSGRLFDSDGTPLTGEFVVNAYSTGYQYLPDVAFNTDGTFVVTWQSDDQDGSLYGIVARRFDANANPLGAEFVVNSYVTGVQYSPKIATHPVGFGVAWDGAGGGDNYGVFARLFNPAGVALGPQFRVNTATANEQAYASVGSGGGQFVVAWEDINRTAVERDVFARRFTLAGPQGLEFRVNTTTADYQMRPGVGVDGAGQFMVSWQSGTTYGAYLYDVKGQMYSAAGAAVGSEFTVNSYTTGDQAYPSVAAGRSGNFLVAWEGDDAGSFDVYGQRLGDLIFSDNFDIFP